MKSWIKIIISIICVLVADLVTKHFLFHIEYFNLIPNIISISGNVENTGFSRLFGYPGQDPSQQISTKRETYTKSSKTIQK